MTPDAAFCAKCGQAAFKRTGSGSEWFDSTGQVKPADDKSRRPKAQKQAGVPDLHDQRLSSAYIPAKSSPVPDLGDDLHDQRLSSAYISAKSSPVPDLGDDLHDQRLSSAYIPA